MTTNPFIEQSVLLGQERKLLIKHAHKFSVDALYNWGKPIKEEVFDMMRIFCAENHIQFEIRAYNSEVYVEDREEVTILPAYNIYIEDEFETTLYPNPDCATQLRALILKQEKPRKKKPTPWFSWTFTVPTIRSKRVPMASSAPDA
jgi:hypothetical protein